MKYLLIIPLATLSLYLLFVYVKYGMSYSISASYRYLQGWEKVLFTLTMWAVAIPIMILGIDSVPNNYPEILFFLAGAGICLVGASPAYWSGKMELTAHLIGSYGGIGFGMIACVLYLFSPLTVILVSLYAAFAASQMLIKKLQVKNYVYWLEVVALIVVCSILYLV